MELNKKTIKKILLIVAFGVVLWWGLWHFDTFAAVVKKIGSVFTPFLLGASIAFIVNLVMRPLEELWHKAFKDRKLSEKLRRPVCLVLSFLFVLSVIFLICFIVLPQLWKTISAIISESPSYLARLEAWWNGLRWEIGETVITLPQFQLSEQNILDQLPDLKELWDNVGKTVFDTTIGAATSIVSSVANLILALVFACYVLAQKENLGRQFKKLFFAIFREKTADSLVNFTARAGRTFASFVTGQLTEAVILGSLCFIGMLILRMPYAGLISVLVSVTALIPIFGAWIGAVVGALLILTVEPIQALWFLIFLICLQQFEGNVIYPHVVGKSVGLPGIWVFASVTVAAAAFGILGMLLCVPVSAIGYELLRELVNRRLEAKQAKAAEAVEPAAAPISEESK